MTACFADTSYYIALLNRDDDSHQAVSSFTDGFEGRYVTTSAVLNELGNHLAYPPNRELFNNFLSALRIDAGVQIIHVDQRLFDAGATLYAERPDQEWSLTDCISFVVMTELSLTDALSLDHHFEQAGFRLVLSK